MTNKMCILCNEQKEYSEYSLAVCYDCNKCICQKCCKIYNINDNLQNLSDYYQHNNCKYCSNKKCEKTCNEDTCMYHGCSHDYECNCSDLLRMYNKFYINKIKYKIKEQTGCTFTIYYCRYDSCVCYDCIVKAGEKIPHPDQILF